MTHETRLALIEDDARRRLKRFEGTLDRGRLRNPDYSYEKNSTKYAGPDPYPELRSGRDTIKTGYNRLRLLYA